MIKIKISNRITIEQPPPELLGACKRALTLENPTYHRNKRMGIKVWESQRFYKYYKITENGIEIPRGFRSRLIAWLDRVDLQHEIEENLIDRPLK